MNVFVAGIHGVGKTYLCERASQGQSFTHASASKLIREQLALPEWHADKKVADIEGNQRALIGAIKRYVDAGRQILLDGHFILLDSVGTMKKVPEETFASLAFSGVILLEKDLEAIKRQIEMRDQRSVNMLTLGEQVAAEREQAVAVCRSLGIPLEIMVNPEVQAFRDMVTRLFERGAKRA